MKSPRLYTQTEAAAFIGVTRQAVRARFLSARRYPDVPWRDEVGEWAIPHADLVRWQAERRARAQKLLKSATVEKSK